MLAPIIIACITCVLMLLSILFFPKLRIGKLQIDTYWIVTLLGAVLSIIFGGTDIAVIGRALVADTAINPLKILVLFFSMTLLSVYLDELGFFRYLASMALRRAGNKQTTLFFCLYLTVSVLTVFTSNDIIILSFTPFICYFAANADIDPIPYLVAEFVAANTWSMALIIGNPTNIYLATACGIGFVEYIKYSFLPTLFGAAVSLSLLYLLFRKKLRKPIAAISTRTVIGDKLSLWVGIAHLAICTLLLAVSSYIGLEMWIVALCSVGSLTLFSVILSLVRHSKPHALIGCVKRAPYALIPFVLSMFVLIVVLDNAGVTQAIARLMGDRLPILLYGATSFVASNLINNIPMSVLFASILQSAGNTAGIGAVMATIIGSNIGAFLTPIGALAGIMWGSLIGRRGIRFGYLDFVKTGAAVAIPTLFAALGGLWLACTIF